MLSRLNWLSSHTELIMPVIAERQIRIPLKDRKKLTFSPPGWEVITFPRPANEPEVYLRKEDVGSSGIPHTVIILDEKIEQRGESYSVVTQWILGHHDILHYAKRHQGLQGKEMIRQFRRTKLVFNGVEEVQDREVDISDPRTCNRWGRVLY